MFKVNNKDTKTTPASFMVNVYCYRLLLLFIVFIVNFKHISHLYSSVSIVNFEQVSPGWVILTFCVFVAITLPIEATIRGVL